MREETRAKREAAVQRLVQAARAAEKSTEAKQVARAAAATQRQQRHWQQRAGERRRAADNRRLRRRFDKAHQANAGLETETGGWQWQQPRIRTHLFAPEYAQLVRTGRY